MWDRADAQWTPKNEFVERFQALAVKGVTVLLGKDEIMVWLDCLPEA